LGPSIVLAKNQFFAFNLNCLSSPNASFVNSAIEAATSKSNNGTASAIHNSNDGSNDIEELVTKIKSADSAVQLAAVTQARQLLSNVNSNTTIDAMISCGILPPLVNCLELTKFVFPL
jgi:hypothetical protein